MATFPLISRLVASWLPPVRRRTHLRPGTGTNSVSAYSTAYRDNVRWLDPSEQRRFGSLQKTDLKSADNEESSVCRLHEALPRWPAWRIKRLMRSSDAAVSEGILDGRCCEPVHDFRSFSKSGGGDRKCLERCWGMVPRRQQRTSPLMVEQQIDLMKDGGGGFPVGSSPFSQRLSCQRTALIFGRIALRNRSTRASAYSGVSGPERRSQRL